MTPPFSAHEPPPSTQTPSAEHGGQSEPTSARQDTVVNGVMFPGVPPEHEHRKGQPCTPECPYYATRGWRVWPDEWENDAEAITAEVDEIRRVLSRLRRRLDVLSGTPPIHDGEQAWALDMDSARVAKDARGCVQGAIVTLHYIEDTYRKQAQQRAAIDARLPR